MGNACPEMPAFLRAPLWPAGHLPLKGGDWLSSSVSPIANVAEWTGAARLLISPLEGEMAGRPEGGNVKLYLSRVPA